MLRIAEPIVRIHPSPAKSLRTIGSRARDKLIDEATKPRNRSPISARYYKFESISLQRRVRLSTGISPPRSRSRAFRANVRAMPGDGVGRDRYGRATSHHWRRMSLLGQISVPRGRRWIEADRGVLPATGGFQPKSDGSSYSAIALRTKSTRSDTPILGTVQTS